MIETIKIGNMHVVGMDEEQTRVLKGRDAFVDDYCREKGWQKDDLGFEQIMEIRKQEGWKNPAT